MYTPCLFANVAPRRRDIPPRSDTSPLYWMIGEAVQKPPKCSLCLERGRLGIAIFSGFKNVLFSLKICDTFAFFQHRNQKSLSLRTFLKLLNRLITDSDLLGTSFVGYPATKTPGTADLRAMLRQMNAAGRCGTAMSSPGGYSFDYAAASVGAVPGPIVGAGLPALMLASV